MYSKTAAILMLLGFCSGASNLYISSTGTQKIHAGEISVAQAGTSLYETARNVDDLQWSPQGVETVTQIFGVLVTLALVFTIIAIVSRKNEEYALCRFWNKHMKNDDRWIEPLVVIYLVLFILSTMAAIQLPSEVTETRHRIVLWICAGVTGLPVFCGFVYSFVLLILYIKQDLAKQR